MRTNNTKIIKESYGFISNQGGLKINCTTAVKSPNTRILHNVPVPRDLLLVPDCCCIGNICASATPAG